MLLISKMFLMEDNNFGKREEKESDSEHRAKDHRTSNRLTPSGTQSSQA